MTELAEMIEGEEKYLASPFVNVEMAEPDAIFGIRQLYEADPNPRKVELSASSYQNEEGKTLRMGVVPEVHKLLIEEEQRVDYLPIDGMPEFCAVVQRLVFGDDCDAVGSGKVVTVQSVGGTGAVRCGAEFLHYCHPESPVFLSDPTWPNHPAIFKVAGFAVEKYPYYNSEQRGVDFEALCASLKRIEPNGVVVLHACCHNPTGADLSKEQWRELAELFQERRLMAFFDLAYQGLGESLDEDAFAVRLFEEKGLSFLVATSYSKNFSLYRRRIGSLSVVCKSSEEAARVRSQLKRVIRTLNSNCPVDGASIVYRILSNSEYRARWESELRTMQGRLMDVRLRLLQALEGYGCADLFSFLRGHHGMFSYTGLSKEQIQLLREDYGIYMLESGRLGVVALNASNMDYVAGALARVCGR